MSFLFFTDLVGKKIGGTLAKQGSLGENFLYLSGRVKSLKIKCDLFILSFKDYLSLPSCQRRKISLNIQSGKILVWSRSTEEHHSKMQIFRFGIKQSFRDPFLPLVSLPKVVSRYMKKRVLRASLTCKITKILRCDASILLASATGFLVNMGVANFADTHDWSILLVQLVTWCLLTWSEQLDLNLAFTGNKLLMATDSPSHLLAQQLQWAPDQASQISTQYLWTWG